MGHEKLVEVIGIKEEFDRRGILLKIEMKIDNSKVERFVLAEQIFPISKEEKEKMKIEEMGSNETKKESKKPRAQRRLEEILNKKKRKRGEEEVEDEEGKLEIKEKEEEKEEKEEKEEEKEEKKEDKISELEEILEKNNKKVKNQKKQDIETKNQINKLIETVIEMKNEIKDLKEEIKKNQEINNTLKNSYSQANPSTTFQSNLSDFQINERVLSDYRYWLVTFEDLQKREFELLYSSSNHDESELSDELGSYFGDSQDFNLDGSEVDDQAIQENDPNKWLIDYNDDI